MGGDIGSPAQPSPQPQAAAQPRAAAVNNPPEEVKQVQLNEKQLKALGIIQATRKDYQDALEYA